MPTRGPARPLLLLLALAASAAWAQPRPDGGEAVAPTAAGPVAAGNYRSTFEGYRAFEDVKPTPWRQANETARARGGWRAYAQEAQAPAASEPAKPAAGHHHHDGGGR